jgi:hypothetical protein
MIHRTMLTQGILMACRYNPDRTPFVISCHPLVTLIFVSPSQKAKELIVESGFDPAFGARPLKRAVIRELETPVSRLLIAGELVQGGTLQVDVEDGKLNFSCQLT